MQAKTDEGFFSDASPEPGKVLFIGLDGAEPTLLHRYMAEGDLPAIASLLRAGTAATLSMPPAIGNGGDWPSAFTGMGPASNGRFYFLQFDPASYRFTQFNDDTDSASTPVWTLASEAGKRVAVVDMMRGPLAASINGVQVVDWLTHGRMHAARSVPPELIESVEREFGTDPWHGHADHTYEEATDKDPAAWLATTLDRIDRKGDYSVRLLESEAWDLFATVFSDLHDFGHLFWHLHDPGHPGFDPQWFERHGDPIRAIMRAIDRNVARLLDSAGPDTHVIVYTGPGMGPNYSASHALDDVLRRVEASYGSVPARHRVLSRLRMAYKSTVPEPLRKRLNLSHRLRAVRAAGGRTANRFDPFALSERLFFAVPYYDGIGAVRLNVAGREARGRVRPEEADALVRRLAADLEAIRNAETGEPLVAQLVVAKDHFPQPLAEGIPDLFLVWHRPKPIRRIQSDRIGSLKVQPPPLRTGDHTDHAFIAFRSGRPDQVQMDCARCCAEDLTPTMLQLMGVRSSRAFDGAVRLVPGAGMPAAKPQEDSSLSASPAAI